VKLEFPFESPNLKLANNRYGASELLVNHKAKNAHHSGAALVELDGTLLELPLLALLVPAEVETVTEVSPEFRLSGDVGHDADLKEGNEGQDLEKTSRGDGVRAVNGGKAIGEAREGISALVDITGEVDSSTGDDLAEESKLRDTAVLELDVTEAVEALLVSIIEQTKGVEEAKRRLGSELGLEGIEGSGGLAGLGGGKGGSRSHKGGESGNFHHG